jgi:hypothetical protein
MTTQKLTSSFLTEINERNLPIYERLFHKNRKNQNGCNIKATFFGKKTRNFGKKIEIFSIFNFFSNQFF